MLRKYLITASFVVTSIGVLTWQMPQKSQAIATVILLPRQTLNLALVRTHVRFTIGTAITNTAHARQIALRTVWDKVAVCEEGGNWRHWTFWYPDGIGIDRPNFIQFGGNPNVINSIATQIKVGMRFVANYHIPIPDQNGYCYPY